VFTVSWNATEAGFSAFGMQLGAAADAAAAHGILGLTISVKDFGAAGDGVADDTVEIQAAITACIAAGGGIVFFPAGTYKINGTITIGSAGVDLLGTGPFSSKINVVSTNVNAFEFKTAGLYLGGAMRSIGIFGQGTHTAGAAILIENVGDIAIEDVRIQTTFNGILVNMGVAGAGRLERVHQSDIINAPFFVTSTNELGILDCSVFRNVKGGDAAIRISNGEGIHISTCSLGGYTHALAIEPGNGQHVFNVWVSDCDLDASKTTGLRIAKSGTGEIRECLFSNNRYGYTDDGAGGGRGIAMADAEHITFLGGHVVANILSGVQIMAGCTNVHFIGVTVAGNNVTDSATEYGYDIAGGDGIEIIGGMSGTYTDGLGVSDNQRYGINIQAGFTGVLKIIGVDLRGNVTGTIQNASTSTNIVSYASNGVGYDIGSGGTVTQATNKSTAVTLNRLSGQITMNAAALASGAAVAFTLNNSVYAAATDIILAHHASGGTNLAYRVDVFAGGANAVAIVVTNTTAGSLSEAIVINFVVIKGAST
jgi:hypothetical protein